MRSATLRRPQRRLIALLIASGVGAAQAQEQSFFEEYPTVLTASRLPQALENAPGAMTVITREQIQASGYRDISRLFRLVPGMQIGQERGHNSWVTYHGLGNNYPSEMQVLIDGRSVYSPSSFGGMDWSSLPLAMNEIERIEILRGTNAATYGANAFLGVINIITRPGGQEPGTRVAARVGTQGIGDLSASTNFQSGPVGMRFSALTRNDTGFDSMYDTNKVGIFSARGDFQASKDDQVMLRLAGSNYTRGEGYPTSTYGNNALRDASGQSYAVHAQWTHAASLSNEWVFNFYRNHENVSDDWNASAPPNYPAVPLSRTRQSTRDNIEFQNRFAPSLSTQLVWGASWRRDEIDSSFLYAGGTQPIDTARLFGNLEWRALPTLSFNLGANIEQFTDEPAYFAPRLFANWNASKSDTFRVGGARAYQQRPTFETDGDVRAIDPVSGTLLVRPYVPNAELVQPRIDSFELGYLGRYQTLSSSLDVRLFHENVTNYIVRQPYTAAQNPPPLLGSVLGSYQYTNYDQSVLLRGIEYEFKFKGWQGSQFAFTHTLIDREANNAYIEARTAPYTASLTWNQNWTHGWSSTLTVLRMGAMSGTDGFAPTNPYLAEPYTTVDARIAWTTLWGGKRAEFALNAINLASNHQEIADGTQQAALPSGQVANPVSPMIYLSAALAF